MPERRRYWPFEVTQPAQRAVLEAEQFAFLEAAYDAGFWPFAEGLNFGATAPGPRWGMICSHHTNFADWYELRVGPNGLGKFDFSLVPFAVAADALLKWLRGDDIEAIEQVLLPHLVSPFDKRNRHLLLGRAGGSPSA